MRARGKGSSPGRVVGSSRAMLATARPSCFVEVNSRSLGGGRGHVCWVSYDGFNFAGWRGGCGWDMAIFRLLKMTAARHLGFWNSENFNNRSGAQAPDASSYQFKSKLAKRLRRCGNFSIFFQYGGRPPCYICGAHFGPFAKSTWRSLLSDKIWLESIE